VDRSFVRNPPRPVSHLDHDDVRLPNRAARPQRYDDGPPG
jgi:hypothetical protein